MKYKLVIFDLDGTILDTLEDLAASANYAMQQFGYPTRTIDEIRRFVGNGIGKLIKNCLPEDSKDFDGAIECFRQHYMQHNMDLTHPYDGVEDLLKQLKSTGVKLAVVSNKIDGAVKEIINHYFPDVFDISVGEMEGLSRKPDPALVNYALEKLNVKKEDAVYIGDSEVDVMTANNSQMDLICVDYGFRSQQQLIDAGAKVICHNPSEIWDALNKDEKYLLSVFGSSVDMFYGADSYPVEGDYSHAKQLGNKAGGPPLNMGAVAASKGANVKALDYLSDKEDTTPFLLEEAKRLGFDVSNIQFGEAVNGKVLIITTDGNRTMFVVDPVRPYYVVDEKMQDLLNNATYIYSLMHMITRSFENLEPLKIAKQHGAKILFDGSSKYDDISRANMLLQLADGLFVNETSYADLKNCLGKEPKDELFARGAQFVCVTEGSKQAVCYYPGGKYVCKSLKLDHVVDSTGAGDSFAGGFTYGLLQGYDLEKCLRIGCASGAYCCMHFGGQGGCCSMEELRQFAKEHDFEID